MDSCNRSLPHVRLVNLALRVINNIVRYGVDENKAMQQPQYIASLFSLLKVHLDRPDVLIPATDVLINICSHPVSGPLFVRVITQNAKLMQRFQQMYNTLKSGSSHHIEDKTE